MNNLRYETLCNRHRALSFSYGRQRGPIGMPQHQIAFRPRRSAPRVRRHEARTPQRLPRESAIAMDEKALKRLKLRKNFEKISVDGKGQNCFYKCIALGSDSRLLKQYVVNKKAANDRLHGKSERLRESAVNYGRLNFDAVAGLMKKSENYASAMNLRGCASLEEAFVQIEGGNVPADCIDQCLIANALGITIIVYSLETGSKAFSYTYTFAPTLGAEKPGSPPLFLLYSFDKTHARIDHFDLLLCKHVNH